MADDWVPRGTKLDSGDWVPRGTRLNDATAKGPDPSEGMAWDEKALVGAGYAIERTVRSVKGLARTMARMNADPADEAIDAENSALYKKYHPGGWATAGEIGADVAMSAYPVAKVGGVLTQTLGKIPIVARSAPAIADIAANAGYSAATNEDRGMAALYGAAGAAGGRVLTKTLGQPIKPTTTAQEMLDAGFHLTPGMASSSPVGTVLRRTEGVLERLPGVGAPIRSAKERLSKELEDFTEYGATMEKTLLEARGAPVTKQTLAKERSALARGSKSATTGELIGTGLGATLAWYIAHPGVPASAAIISYIGSHPVGAKVLMGQYPLQRFITENPEIASRLSRAITTQQQQE